MIVGSAEKTTVLEESSLTCFTDSSLHFSSSISTTVPVLSIENSSGDSLQNHHSSLVGALLDGRRHRVTPERHSRGFDQKDFIHKLAQRGIPVYYIGEQTVNHSKFLGCMAIISLFTGKRPRKKSSEAPK
jgi:hypothetical protein